MGQNFLNNEILAFILEKLPFAISSMARRVEVCFSPEICNIQHVELSREISPTIFLTDEGHGLPASFTTNPKEGL